MRFRMEDLDCCMNVIHGLLYTRPPGEGAINGKQRILDVEFKDIHQRTPLFIGSTLMIQQLEMYLAEENL